MRTSSPALTPTARRAIVLASVPHPFDTLVAVLDEPENTSLFTRNLGRGTQAVATNGVPPDRSNSVYALILEEHPESALWKVIAPDCPVHEPPVDIHVGGNDHR